MALLAHKKAYDLYKSSERERGETWRGFFVQRADSAKARDHLIKLIEMRRLLYGAWNEELLHLLKEDNFFPDDDDDIKDEKPDMFLHTLN